jgi:hypothetical protein
LDVVEHYVYPRAKVGFTLIPKTGCSTLKNYLGELERSLSDEGRSVEQAGESEYLGMSVHYANESTDYLVEGLENPQHGDIFKILVVRNPYERILSAWTNKLLYAQDDLTLWAKVRGEPFVLEDFESLEELNSAFEGFLCRLAADKEFLLFDHHWIPQVNFVKDIAAYDLVIETGSLSTLQTALSGRETVSHLVVSRPVPVFNASRTGLKSLIGSDQAWSIVESVFAEDFEMLKAAGFATISRPSVTALDERALLKLIKAEKPIIFYERIRAELAVAKSELAVAKSELAVAKSELGAISPRTFKGFGKKFWLITRRLRR